MANYTDTADIEATVGITFGANSRPTLTQLPKLQTKADGIINKSMKEDSNITDTYGFLRAIECDLVYKMINNILALAEPERYDYMDIVLSEQDAIDIRTTYNKWASLTWDIGQ